MNKKNVPFELLKMIKKIKENYSTIYKISQPKDVYALFNDMDVTSEFYFKIEKGQKLETYKVEFFPKNRSVMEIQSSTVKINNVESYLNNWLALIKDYNNNDAFENSIINDYEREIFDSFNIDKDDKSALTSTELIKMDAFLDSLSAQLDNSDDLNEIKNDIKLLSENLTRNSRIEAFRKLSKIGAKLKFHGFKFFKNVIKTAESKVHKIAADETVNFFIDLLG